MQFKHCYSELPFYCVNDGTQGVPSSVAVLIATVVPVLLSLYDDMRIIQFSKIWVFGCFLLLLLFFATHGIEERESLVLDVH